MHLLPTFPLYLKDLIKVNNRNRLRSDAALTLIRPSPPKTKAYGERAFMIAAPALWNLLPIYIRNISEFDRFKTSLKTYLFESYYV